MDDTLFKKEAKHQTSTDQSTLCQRVLLYAKLSQDGDKKIIERAKKCCRIGR